MASQRAQRLPLSRRAVGGFAFAVFLVYCGTLTNGFIGLDDGPYILDNPQVRGGLTAAGLQWAWTSVSYFYWQPITWISHMIDCEMFGLQPGGHHLTNVVIHSINAVLFLLLLQTLTGSPYRSLIAAGLFAVHPLRVESVAWVAERKDLLSGTFFLAALIAYVHYTRKPDWRRYLWVVGCYFLALASKPTAITLPLVLLLLDYWPLSRLRPLWPALREKAPLLVMTAASALVTFWGASQGDAVVAQQDLTIGIRLAHVPVAYAQYFSKFLWPTNLTVLYPYDKALPTWAIAGALAMLCGITVLCLWKRNQPYLLMGWLWFLVVMLPMSGIVQAGLQGYADRFTYLPMMGLAIALVWLAADHLPAIGSGRRGVQAAVVVLLLLAGCSWIQAGYWKDSVTLFGHALSVEPRNAMIQNNLGFALSQTGKVDSALPHFEQAVQLAPEYVQAWMNLGVAYSTQRKPSEAENAFRQATARWPDKGEPHSLLGLLLLENGNERGALTELVEALKYPMDEGRTARSAYEAGNILTKFSRGAEAIPLLRQATQLAPEMVNAHGKLVNALLDQGKADEAVKHLRYAIIATHGNPELRRVLDGLLQQ